jgi:hypothetical protein
MKGEHWWTPFYRYHERKQCSNKTTIADPFKRIIYRKKEVSHYLGSEEQFTIIIFCCTSEGKKLSSHSPYTHSEGNLHLL